MGLDLDCHCGPAHWETTEKEPKGELPMHDDCEIRLGEKMK